MKYFFPRILGMLLAAVMLWACGRDYAYEKTFDIDQASGWTYADSLRFDFEVTDTLRIYNLYLELAHTLAYPYQNLYVRLHTTFPSGQRITEVVSLELAEKTGVWLGDCGGSDCELAIPIQQGAYFNQAGAYRLVVEPFMRIDSLPGIQSVSFLLEETEEQRTATSPSPQPVNLPDTSRQQ